MAFDLDNPTIDETTDRGSQPAVDEPSTRPRSGRSRSARSIVGWAIVGALVAATVGFVVAVMAGGDGADRPAPDAVTVEDVSGSDRHLENLADEIEERARARHLDATADAMAAEARERGIPVPTTTPTGAPDSSGDGEPEAYVDPRDDQPPHRGVPTTTPDSTADNGSDRHLENMADELAEQEQQGG